MSGQVIVWVQINIDARVVGWTPGRWCMQSKRVRERGRHGSHGRVPGYMGTYLVSFGGVLLVRTQHKQRVPRPAAWGVRGKPNELKRLDVPVPVPTSRPPLAIRNESATRAGTACSFIQGWLGSTHCLSSRPLSAQHRCTPQYSTAQQGKSTGRAAAASGPIKTSPQTCPASTHSLPLDGTDDVLYLFALQSIAFCIVSHCVAVARQSVSVSGSFLPDRYTLGAHHNPISYPPCLFYLTHFPQFASPPYITPLDAISQSQTILRLSLSLLYISLCPSFSCAFSAVNSEPLHLTHPIQFNLVGHFSTLGQNRRISKSCLLMWLHIPELTTFESN